MVLQEVVGVHRVAWAAQEGSQRLGPHRRQVQAEEDRQGGAEVHRVAWAAQEGSQRLGPHRRQVQAEEDRQEDAEVHQVASAVHWGVSVRLVRSPAPPSLWPLLPPPPPPLCLSR